MSAGWASERRRGERRRTDEQRFWRALGGERRVGERRRDPRGTSVPARADGTLAPGSRDDPLDGPLDNPLDGPLDGPGSADDPNAADTSSTCVTVATVAAPPGTPPGNLADAKAAPVAAPPGAAPPDTPPAPPVVDPGADPDAARRAALRQLLRAAEARQLRSRRARRPVLGPGARVRVLRGELAGRLATVVDADYIHARVLLDPDGDTPSLWVPFGGVGAI